MAVNNKFLENTYSLSCNNCGHRSEERNTFEEAIEAWNQQQEDAK